jgi:peptide deformylase
MAKLRVRVYGDPILRRVAEPVPEVNDEIRALVEDMLETMYEEEGIGLAAPQIGRSIRLLVADTQRRGSDERGPIALINPVIKDATGEWIYDEGCLSLPGLSAEISRAKTVRVEYLTPDGEKKEETFDDVLGRVVLHENDHLEGKLFIDYLSPMRRAMILKKLRKIAKEANISAPAL